MNSLSKHLLTGLLFAAGIYGVVNGEFIISSALFAITTYTSSIKNRKS
ncbi:hypothetical protein [Methylomonas rivi]|uniref:Uncharacterized protein n=1 Tax=Methylomonas rivi TaxID=2952226 RepID=A0ABT1U9R7_9GAMM|nr:hypothetical protein [Methylomonas sp. WSC-6]MCQ8130085.1 hypothetical protein [Methylomonas sp. WSC-6]